MHPPSIPQRLDQLVEHFGIEQPPINEADLDHDTAEWLATERKDGRALPGPMPATRRAPRTREELAAFCLAQRDWLTGMGSRMLAATALGQRVLQEDDYRRDVAAIWALLVEVAAGEDRPPQPPGPYTIEAALCALDAVINWCRGGDPTGAPEGGWSRPMTINVLSRKFQVHRNTMRQWLTQGKVRAVPVGRFWRVAEADLPD